MKLGKKTINGDVVTVDFPLLKKEVEAIHLDQIGSVEDTATYQRASEYHSNNSALNPRISKITGGGGGKIIIRVTHKVS